MIWPPLKTMKHTNILCNFKILSKQRPVYCALFMLFNRATLKVIVGRYVILPCNPRISPILTMFSTGRPHCCSRHDHQKDHGENRKTARIQTQSVRIDRRADSGESEWRRGYCAYHRRTRRRDFICVRILYFEMSPFLIYLVFIKL